MRRLPEPDWEKPIMTGVWGLGFHVSPASDLVLLSNGANVGGSNPDRPWLFLLIRDGQRDVEGEQGIKADERLLGLLECRAVNKECILGVREKHLEELLGVLRKGSA